MERNTVLNEYISSSENADQVFEPLDETSILAGMDSEIRKQLTGLTIEPTVDSTNSALQRLPPAQQHATAILAEHQSTGRGRRGRQWHSPHGGNLYLSLGWKFENPLVELACLPLVVALSVAQALTRIGLKGHKVKWPNDLLLEGHKLCGCLVEVQGDAQGPCHTVLGVGINVRMPASETVTEIDQPWTDLQSHLPGCSRNDLATLLLEEMLLQLALFAEQGFVSFTDHWEQMDGLKGQVVNIHAGSSLLKGTVRGIDAHGALMLDTGNEVLSLHSGEVSLHKTNTI